LFFLPTEETETDGWMDGGQRVNPASKKAATEQKAAEHAKNILYMHLHTTLEHQFFFFPTLSLVILR